jgi:hypothetical protein
MATPSASRTTYLLVVRDAFNLSTEAGSRHQAGALLGAWLNWHESLQARGWLRGCGAARPADRTAGEECAAIIGFLLVAGTSFAQAAEIAVGCPGLAHGFTIEIRGPFGHPAVGTNGDPEELFQKGNIDRLVPAGSAVFIGKRDSCAPHNAS